MSEIYVLISTIASTMINWSLKHLDISERCHSLRKRSLIINRGSEIECYNTIGDGIVGVAILA
jgi:hypothetical protein